MQLDGKLPNIALMKIASYHKSIGDTVHFSRVPQKSLFDPEYEKVYASAIFDYSKKLIETTKKEYPQAIIGGTGSGASVTVENFVGTHSGLDYSLYPDFQNSIGFTQRGCRLRCKFCVVPQKEGSVYEDMPISSIWRGGTFPKNLILLDNDFFGSPLWKKKLRELEGYKVSICQGINVRLVDEEIAEAIAHSLQYYDLKFSRRRLYTAWDNLGDEKIFLQGINRLLKAGIPPRHIMAYMLIGYKKGETLDDIFYRFNMMINIGLLPYPMVYNRSNRELKKFQRWVVRGYYRFVRWQDFQ